MGAVLDALLAIRPSVSMSPRASKWAEVAVAWLLDALACPLVFRHLPEPWWGRRA